MGRPATAEDQGLVIGRYVVFDEIAAGGMATVHLGRLTGSVGFSRTVAIKRLHGHLSRDQDFVTMFLDEARLAARIRHPNVVGVLDIVNEGGEIFLVMDYVQGESLSRLARAAKPALVPAAIAVTVMTGALHGLHAAHEATSEQAEPLNIVHRDVSPQNVMIGSDGIARIFDFGVAKASNRSTTTQDGTLKGKISYMAPEQLLSESVDRRADIYSAAVVLWEALTGKRLFEGDSQGRVVRKILDEPVLPPSTVVPSIPAALDEAIMRGLERDVSKRWQTARDFAGALEQATAPASSTEIGEWVESLVGAQLESRAKRLTEIESRSETSLTAAPRIETPRSVKRPITDGIARAESLTMRPQMGMPTVPQAFAVLSRKPSSEPPKPQDVHFSEPPPAPPADLEPLAPAPSRLSSRSRVAVMSPFAPMAVQTLTLAKLATLDPVPLPKIEMPVAADSIPPPAKKRTALIGFVVLFVLVAFVVTWRLLAP